MTDSGGDFDDVQVYDGEDAPADLGAAAYTGGNDPDFGDGDGDDLLAHELTHVVQQGAADPEIEIDGV